MTIEKFETDTVFFVIEDNDGNLIETSSFRSLSNGYFEAHDGLVKVRRLFKRITKCACGVAMILYCDMDENGNYGPFYH